MPKVDQTYYFKATIQKVWQAFTDASVMEKWGAGPARMDVRVGGEFSLWGGDVHGITTEIKPMEILRQDWYGDDNPDRKYDVTFTFGFDEYRGQVTVRIEHEAADDDIQSAGGGWRDYYIRPIKALVEPTRKESELNISLELVGKVHVTDNVWSFIFKPSQQIFWTAGQYIWVELPHKNSDEEGDRRWFTIASAPYEELVQITTRVTNSTFKQALNALQIGGKVKLIEKPDGDFIWHDSELPTIFVAGGIGITAFHSILKQRVHEQAALRLTLVYGNRDEHAPFKDELEQWAKNNPGFKIKYITGMPLTAEGLMALQPGLNNSLVYISGPEKMVHDLSDSLLRNGLHQSRLRLDALPNYTKHDY